MKIFLLIGLLLIVGTFAIAATKIESGSVTAQSYVLYGQGPTGIVSLKVDADGVLQLK